MPIISLPNVHVPFADYVLTSLRFTLKKQPLLLVLIFPLLTGMLTVYALVSGQASLAELWNGGSGIINLVLAAYVFLGPILFWRSFRKQYDSNQFLQAGASYTLTPQGVTVQHPLTLTELDWAGVQEAWHIGPWLILLVSGSTGYFLDLRCLAEPANEAAVWSLLRAQGVKLK
jgi:hypothetical protein